MSIRSAKSAAERTSPLRFVEAVGWHTIQLIRGLAAVAILLGEVLAWCLAGGFYRQPVRLSAVAYQIVELGLKCLPLAFIFAVAFGLVLSIQIQTMRSAIDLLSPILGFYADLLAREQAPLLVGILVASRNGSAIASDLSSMAAGSEIAALRGMGIDPVRFLVAPALIAMMIVTPILILLMVSATLLTVAIYLYFAQGASPILVIGTAVDGIGAGDLGLSLAKGLLFGVLVVGIAASIGLSARARFFSVGRAVMFAVVAGITAILVTNAAITIFTA